MPGPYRSHSGCCRHQRTRRISLVYRVLRYTAPHVAAEPGSPVRDARLAGIRRLRAPVRIPRKCPNFFYKNTGTPEHRPAGDTDAQREDLRRQIGAAEILIAVPDLFAEHPDLLIFQMNFAKSAKKPVILMQPFGSREPVNELLKNRASEVVDWDERGVVDAIRRLARHEGTSRYETVEFNAEEFKDFKLD